MRYDKVKTLEEIRQIFGNWSIKHTKALRDDIVEFAGDSTVVEVPIDVGACLCSMTDILDFSLVNDMTTQNHIQLETNAGLYIGKIVDTDIHLFTIDEYDLVSPMKEGIFGDRFPDLRISIEMVPVKAEEKTLKTQWAFDETTMLEERHRSNQNGVGKKFQHDMGMIREIADK